MKIGSINYYGFPKQQNFKGLSKTYERVDDKRYYSETLEKDFGTYASSKIVDYYPFADETIEETDKFVQENTYNRTSANDSDFVDYVETSVVNVQEPLKMRKTDYMNYLTSMDFAKHAYESQKELERRNGIVSYAPLNVRFIEMQLREAGLDNCLAKV